MVYGWPAPEQHPNFVSESIASLRDGGEVTAFSDLVRTPIYLRDLADSLAKLILTEREGLYHHGSSNVVTMHAFALQMCDVFACDRDLVRASAEGASQGNGRPAACGLTTDKVAHALGDRLPTTLEGLTRMKEDEVSDV
jgi:dTDP-4-dehydrorhamnose reductase